MFDNLIISKVITVGGYSHTITSPGNIHYFPHKKAHIGDDLKSTDHGWVRIPFRTECWSTFSSFEEMLFLGYLQITCISFSLDAQERSNWLFPLGVSCNLESLTSPLLVWISRCNLSWGSYSEDRTIQIQFHDDHTNQRSTSFIHLEHTQIL